MVKRTQSFLRFEESMNGYREPDATTRDYTLERIEADEAKEFIKRYEWSQTVGHPQLRIGARAIITRELAAVALFGRPGVTKLPDNAIVYERGACASWAAENTASWFINRACRMAHKERGWQVFVAYCDPAAEEEGKVYQASGWLYLGQSTTRLLKGEPRPRLRFRNIKTGEELKERTFRRRGFTMDDVYLTGEWECIPEPPKLKYVHIEGDTYRERRELLKQFTPLPYPKREAPESGG